MSSENKLRLDVTTVGPMNQFASVSLYDSYDVLVKRQYCGLDVMVEKGLYRLTVESNENVIEKNLRIEKDYHEVITLPGTCSSFLMKGFASSHEYYTEPAVKWSTASTLTQEMDRMLNVSASPHGSLFLFFRYSAKEQREGSNQNSLGRNFFLIDRNREIVTAVEGKNIRENTKDGWMAFHALLPKGQYFLYYEGEPKREIPLYVFESWQT